VNKPSCYAHVHLTPEEYGLWTYGRTVSHESNIVYLSGRHIAQEFFETNKDAIYRIAEGMEAKGWARKLRSKRRHPKTGQWISADYRFLSHDEWVQQYGNSFCKVSDVHDPDCPVENSRQAPSDPCLENSPSLSKSFDRPVENSGHPVENSRHQYKSNYDSQSKRKRESEATTEIATPRARPASEINRQVSELKTWMLGLPVPLKFVPGSKDGEHESTKAIVARHLQNGVSVSDLKLAIGKVPLDSDPNPSFAIRESLDAAIGRVHTDREQAERSKREYAAALEREITKGQCEREEAEAREAEATAFIEETLPQG